jgi:MoaA/NifB/PqqE/SkfB family radical SAM enzyme
MKKFICQSKLEINDKCNVQCKHCKEYFGELEEQLNIEQQLKEANELLKSIFVKEHVSNVGWDWECNEYFKKYEVKI